MKKLILFTAIATFSLLSHGQAKIAVGVKGGMNFSNITVSNNISSSGKTGFHGGAFALLKFSKIGLQPEIIFSQQGSKVNVDDWDTKYLNIPIIVKLYFGAGINFQAGPQFGFLNKSELKNGKEIKDLLKSSDISLGLGFGWDAPFNLSFDARYNLGLTNNNNDPDIESIKNQVIQLSVGFKLFSLGK